MIYKKFTLSNFKIQKLIKKHGIIGYAIYNYLQELIHKNNSKLLLLNETIKKEICDDMQIDSNLFDLILREMIVLQILKTITYEGTSETYLANLFYDSKEEDKNNG